MQEKYENEDNKNTIILWKVRTIKDIKSVQYYRSKSKSSYKHNIIVINLNAT